MVARPWDIARRTVHLETLKEKKATSAWTSVVHKVQRDGVRSFFELPLAHDNNAQIVSKGQRRLHRLMRTLGRVGPWGIGFLVWEIYGGGV